MSPGPAAPLISRVRIANYRSIASADVALSPLTVLVGPNAAGKTNFLDAIRFVTDAVTTSPAEAVAKRGGMAALVHRNPQHAVGVCSFRIDLELAEPGETGGASARYAVEMSHAETGRLTVPYEVCRGAGSPSWAALSFKRTTDNDGVTHIEGPIELPDLEPDQLALSVLGRMMRPFSEFLGLLQAPRFYDLNTTALRALDETDPAVRTDTLGTSGEHLGHVLGLLDAAHPPVKATLDGYLSALVDNALSVDQKKEGRFSTVSARFRTDHGETGVTETFERESLSEGTLRLAGVLAALFQPKALTGAVPLIAIEEPEKAIHPPRLGGLYEALVAASRTTQVLVTTQSADLLDSGSADPAHILAAVNEGGATTLGPLDDTNRSLVADKAMTLSELLRAGLVRPATPAPSDDPESPGAAT